MELHELGVVAHGNRVQPAVAALDKLYASALGAETRVENLETSTVKLNSTMSRFRGSIGNATSSLGRFTSKSGGAIGGMRGLGFQLNQVAQVGAMTGNWLEALAIQMPDILLGFGTMGIFAGIAAAALIPLAKGIVDMNDYTGRYEKAQKALNDSLKEYNNLVQAATASGPNLAKQYGDQAENVRIVLKRQAKEAGDKVREDVSNIMGEIIEGMEAHNYGGGLVAFFGLSSLRSESRKFAAEIESDFTNVKEALTLDDQFQALTRLIETYNKVSLGRTRARGYGWSTDELEYLTKLEDELVKVADARQRSIDLGTKPIAFEFDKGFWADLDSFNKDLKSFQELSRGMQADLNTQQLGLDFGPKSAELFDAQMRAQRESLELKIRDLSVSNEQKESLRAILVATQNVMALEREREQTEIFNSREDKGKRILQQLEAQLQQQKVLNWYGKESINYAESITAAERVVLDQRLKQLKVSDGLRLKALETFDILKATEALKNAPMPAFDGVDSFWTDLDKFNKDLSTGLALIESMRSEADLSGLERSFGADSVQLLERKLEIERALIEKKLAELSLGEDLKRQALDILSEQEALARLDNEDKLTKKAEKGAEILEQLKQQVSQQQAISVFGRDSIQYADAVAATDRVLLAQRLEQLGIAKDLKSEILAVFDTLKAMEQVDIASSFQEAAEWAGTLYDRVVAALGAYRRIADASIANSEERAALAGVRLDTVGNPVERAGREAVVKYRFEAEVNLVKPEDMDGLSTLERGIRSAAEATALAEKAANDADKAYNKLMNPSGGGSLGKSLKALNKEGERVFNATRTEAEKYALELEQINLLHSVGAINADTYKRALADIKEDFANLSEIQMLINDNQQSFVSGLGDAVFGADSLGEAMENVARKIAEAAFEARLLQTLFNTGPWSSSGNIGLLSGLGKWLGNIAFNGSVPATPATATGSTSFGGGWTRMNEYGGEKAYLPSGTKIVPADVTRREERNSNVNVNISVVNQTGVQVDAEVRKTPEGNVEMILTRQMKTMVDSGRMDKSMRDRFGLKPKSRG